MDILYDEAGFHDEAWKGVVVGHRPFGSAVKSITRGDFTEYGIFFFYNNYTLWICNDEAGFMMRRGKVSLQGFDLSIQL